MKKILITLIIGLLAIGIFADSVETIGSNGSNINWSNLTYTAIGEGVMQTPAQEPNRALAYKKAKKYAEMDALRQLLMLIEGTTISYQATGEDFIEANEYIKQEISGYVRNVKIINVEKKVEIGNEIVYVTCVSNMFGENNPGTALLKKQVEFDNEVIKNSGYLKKNDPKVEKTTDAPIVIAPVGAFPIKIDEPKNNQISSETLKPYIPAQRSVDKSYTSVIFDCRGYKLTRSMSPKIRLNNGDVVWCGANFDIELLNERGILAYCNSITEAKKHKYAGENPLYIQAVNIAGKGKFKTDIIISDNDAAVLKDENVKGKFLDKFNVIVICDNYNG